MTLSKVERILRLGRLSQSLNNFVARALLGLITVICAVALAQWSNDPYAHYVQSLVSGAWCLLIALPTMMALSSWFERSRYLKSTKLIASSFIDVKNAMELWLRDIKGVASGYGRLVWEAPNPWGIGVKLYELAFFGPAPFDEVGTSDLHAEGYGGVNYRESTSYSISLDHTRDIARDVMTSKGTATPVTRTSKSSWGTVEIFNSVGQSCTLDVKDESEARYLAFNVNKLAAEFEDNSAQNSLWLEQLRNSKPCSVTTLSGIDAVGIANLVSQLQNSLVLPPELVEAYKEFSALAFGQQAD